MNNLYGDTPAEDFTAARFKAFKQKLIELGRVSTSINHLLGQVRRIFKWGATEDLVPEQVFRTIALVPNVRCGRNEAPEPEPVSPVSNEVVEQTLSILPPILADMVRIQLVTGMRPGEVGRIRPCDLDQTDTTWLYMPHKHKTRWRGKKRSVPIGPQAREILMPYLKRGTETYCFSPRERMEQLRTVRREARKSKVQPSQKSRAKRRPKRTPGEFYTTSSYDKAILAAIRFDFYHCHDGSDHNLWVQMFRCYPFEWWRRPDNSNNPTPEDVVRWRECAMQTLDQKSITGQIWSQQASKSGPPVYQFLKEVLECDTFRFSPWPTPVSVSPDTGIVIDLHAERSDLRRQIQEEAEGIALPKENKSDDNWITASDLAGEIETLEGKKRDTAHRTLDRERGKGKRIWPNDADVPEGGGTSGWAAHKRFWRKRANGGRPVFYYRKTIEKGWEKKMNGQSGDNPQ